VCRDLRPSGRGELEITDVNLEYLRRGKLHVRVLGRGMAWLDTGTQASLLEAANYIAAIENRTGLKIGCLEEIAYNQDFIDEPALEQIIASLPKNEYREYLQMVCEERRATATAAKPAR
jgi:glucose-1-phosphate thymidylyltransferase